MENPQQQELQYSFVCQAIGGLYLEYLSYKEASESKSSSVIDALNSEVKRLLQENVELKSKIELSQEENTNLKD